ncbi:staygreen family protein [Paenibacillus rhizolycopersici]|uniref:staygreen family protein n=1 Tax=Paenibacillus rhizolycopersici TaxID=2780073 RepID=UPI003D2D6640
METDINDNKANKGESFLGHFNPDKLFVCYRDGITSTEPVMPRRHTLTHSDSTGALFLTIGLEYAGDKVNSIRDEVLGEWRLDGGSLIYAVSVYIDQGEYNQSVSARRYETFRRELPLAFTAIRYGDRYLFDVYPELDRTPVIVNFVSSYPLFARQESWGAFRDYSILP